MIDLPTDLTDRYCYNYVAYLQHGSWRHQWEIVGSRGGASLHVSGSHRFDGRDNWAADLELHSRTPLDGDKPPSHDRCWLLHAPCWHLGTSLYAQEVFLPLAHEGDYHRIFCRMIEWADDHLLPKEETE